MMILMLLAFAIEVDPVVYREQIEFQDTIDAENARTVELYYIEFNCGIPYHELQYQEHDGRILAHADIVFELVAASGDLLTDTLRRQFTLSSFAEAARKAIVFVDQFGLYVPPGVYDYALSLTSGAKVGTARGVVAIDTAAYGMSDILLASAVVVDTVGTAMRKGDLRIMPVPGRRFTEQHDRLFVYFEVYDVTIDTSSLPVTYSIHDSTGKLVRRFAQSVPRRGAVQAVNIGISIEGMANGRYRFTVEVADSLAGRNLRKTAPFTIARRVVGSVTYEGMPHYEDIEYLVDPDEYKRFAAMSDDGKRVYLQKFWASRDYYAILDRFNYADGQFTEGHKEGWRTDRGRVYIRYGTPDERQRVTMELDNPRPYERWLYYDGSDFVFVDVRGTGEYVLVWTNAIGEKKDALLYKYLPTSIQHQIEESKSQ